MKFRRVTFAAVFFNAKIIEKQKTSLRSPSLASRVTASSLGRFDRKVGRDRKPEIFSFQVESTGFLGLRARPTLRSNRPGELAVTREARLGDRKLVFRFSKIYALKNTAD